MLVIVEDRNVADLFEFVFDVEAFWSFDVFEVYTAEGWFHQFNGFNDLVRIHGVQTDWELSLIHICCGQTSQLKGISGKSGILRLILKTKIFCVWINKSKKGY